MSDKTVLIDLAQGVGAGLLGYVAGLATFADKISLKLALRYAVFAMISGPLAFYMLDQTAGYSGFKHMGAIAFGYAGFFLFKGLSVVLLRFSVAPIKTFASIVQAWKGKK